eukprot:4019915-Prymnesium_polylepis.2
MAVPRSGVPLMLRSAHSARTTLATVVERAGDRSAQRAWEERKQNGAGRDSDLHLCSHRYQYERAPLTADAHRKARRAAQFDQASAPACLMANSHCRAELWFGRGVS